VAVQIGHSRITLKCARNESSDDDTDLVPI